MEQKETGGTVFYRAPSCSEMLATHIHDLFRATILSRSFPCLGGAGLIRSRNYRFAIYDELGVANSIGLMARDLTGFLSLRNADEFPFTAFIAAFLNPAPADDVAFERAMWAQLEGLEALDAKTDHPPVRLIDETDPGLVYGDREFFIVGMHPASSRWARRFSWPLLVFNALTHADEMRARGKHERMSQLVLGRDRILQGSDNPSLHASQRDQFSGRAVEPGLCPLGHTAHRQS